jgi:hypothetical protein
LSAKGLGRVKTPFMFMTRVTLPDNEKCQSRHDECYDTVADAPAIDAVTSHRLDDRPILPKESRRFLHVRGGYFDATRPPSAIVRYLKEERVANRFPVAANQRSFCSHSVPRLMCVEPGQSAFSILIFVRRDCDARKFVRSVANIRHIEWGHSGDESATRRNWNMGASRAVLFRE